MNATHCECNICKEFYSFSKLRFLLCGHAFCIKCLVKDSQNSKCGFCRQPKQRELEGSNTWQTIRIYPTFPNMSLSSQVEYARERLNEIDEDTPVISIKKAPERIRDIAKEFNDQNLAQSLLDAAQGIEQRIYPMFKEKEKRNELEKQVVQLSQMLETSRSRNAKLTRQQQNLIEEQIKTNGKLSKFVEVEEENRVLWRKIEKLKADLQNKDIECRQLQQSAEEDKKKLHLSKLKMKGIMKKEKIPKAAPDVDESLIVTDAPMEDPHPRRHPPQSSRKITAPR